MAYFTNSYTPEEIKAEYRREAMRLHPDKGGSSKKFQELKDQYDKALLNVSKLAPLPDIYSLYKQYLYHKIPVRYLRRDNCYYYFHIEGGGFVQIDKNNTHLLKAN